MELEVVDKKKQTFDIESKELAKIEDNVIVNKSGLVKKIIILIVILALVTVVVVVVFKLTSSKSKKKSNVEVKILKEDKDFEKNLTDTKVYELGLLPNGLKVIYVQDKDTEIASAALGVKVGSQFDLVNGMAHLTEHAIFGGSKKYPGQTDFDEIVNKYGGTSNAYTDSNFTLFYFEAKNEGFNEILDVFASLLEEPLLNSSYIEGEISAVNSEYLMGKNDFILKYITIFYSKLNPKHPISSSPFQCGNEQSLRNEINFDELVNDIRLFVNLYYRPENMYLTLYGNYTIKELKKISLNYFNFKSKEVKDEAKEKFKNLENGFKEEVTLPENLGKVVYFPGIENKLYFIIIIEPKYKLFGKNPIHYFEYMINGELEGSLGNFIKNLGGSFDYGFLDNDETYSSYAFELLYMDPTTIPIMIKAIYYYMEKLANEGITKEQFENIKKLIDSKNRFGSAKVSSAIDYVDIATNSLRFIENDEEIAKKDKYTDFFKEDLKKFFKSISLKNTIIGITSAEDVDVKTILGLGLFNDTETIKEEYEKYYDTNYYFGDANPDLQKVYKDEEMEGLGFKIKGKNNYITSLTDLVTPCYKNKSAICQNDEYQPDKKNFEPILFYPSLQDSQNISDTGLKIYYQTDKENLLPKVSIFIKIDFPIDPNDKIAYLAQEFMSLIFSDRVKTKGYEYSESNNDVSYSDNYFNTTLTISVFSDKADLAMKDLTSIFFETKILKDEFERMGKLFEYNIHLTQMRGYEGINKTKSTFKRMVFKSYLPKEFSEEELKTVTDFDFMSNIFDKTRNTTKLVMVIKGNIDKNGVEKITEPLIEHYKKNYKYEYITKNERQIKTPKLINFYDKSELSEQGITDLFYKFPKNEFLKDINDSHKIFMPIIFNAYIGNIYFDELRTKRQLGYQASNYFEDSKNVSYFEIFLQGPVLAPHDVEIEMNEVTQSLFENKFSNFEIIKNNKLKDELVIPSNDNERTNYFLKVMTYGGYENYKKIVESAQEKITEEEMNKFMKEYLIEKPYRLGILMYNKNTDLDNVVNNILSKDEYKTYSLNKDFEFQYTNDYDILDHED